MKKILSILLNDFTNDSRVEKQARKLSTTGYDYTVLALHRNDLEVCEVKDSYQINRLKLVTMNMGKNKLIQLIKFFEFCIRARAKSKSYDVLHCHDLSGLIVGCFSQAFKSKKAALIYDSHEFQSEVHGLSSLQKKVRYCIEKILVKKAQHVITVSESIAQEYKNNYKIVKPTVIYNVPDYREAQNSEILREKFNIDKSHTIFIYQGLLTKARGVEKILATFQSLDPTTNASIVFMGMGALADTIKQASSKFSNIYFLPAVEPSMINQYTSSADIGIHLIPNTCLNHDYCMPNKLFEYIMAGLPVIVSNVKDMSEFVMHQKIGFVVKDEQDFVPLILKCLEADLMKLKNKTRELSREFSWDEQSKVLEKIYSTL